MAVRLVADPDQQASFVGPYGSGRPRFQRQEHTKAIYRYENVRVVACRQCGSVFLAKSVDFLL